MEWTKTNATSNPSLEELISANKVIEWLWDALMKVNNQYSQEEFEDVFEVETLGDLISEWDVAAFIAKFKEYDKEREEIHVGDEIRWTEERFVYGGPQSGQNVKERHTGLVLAVEPTSYVVLAYNNDYVGFHKRRLLKVGNNIEKTYVNFAIRSDER